MLWKKQIKISLILRYTLPHQTRLNFDQGEIHSAILRHFVKAVAPLTFSNFSSRIAAKFNFEFWKSQRKNFLLHPAGLKAIKSILNLIFLFHFLIIFSAISFAVNQIMVLLKQELMSRLKLTKLMVVVKIPDMETTSLNNQK
jgi:hypothetical protein